MKRATALIVIGIVSASCRRVPAELADVEAEPARAHKPFVEAQPPPREAPPGAFAPVSAEIAELYRCWFRNPYSYMFRAEGEPLEVNGGFYGTLMAGIGGILWYGNLNSCAGELTGQKPRSYADIAPIEALAGVPATLPSSQFSFATVNPEFIAYARQHLLPPPDQTIEGIPVQLAYDRVFRRFFRMMTASLIMLLETTDIELESQSYLSNTAAGADGLDWLAAQYAGTVPGYNEPWDGTTMTAPMAVGFWLRRHVDGSLAASWHGLREVLDRYDPTWLAEHKARNPKAAALLEQLPDPLSATP